MKKLILSLIMLLIFAIFLSACSDSAEIMQTTEKKEESTVPETTPVGPDYTDNTDRDLDGDEINILAWKDATLLEFESGGVMQSISYGEAVSRRNQIVETRLDCKLAFSYSTGTPEDNESFVKKIESGGEYDIFAAHNRVVPMLALKGLTAELNSLSNAKGLDLSMPWWPEKLSENLSVDGKLYFVTGDISLNFINSLGVLFGNKALIEKAGIVSNNIHRKSISGALTLEELAKYSTDAAIEVDGENKYGFVLGTNGEYAEFFFKASGYKPTVSFENKTSLSVSDATTEKENSSFLATYSFFSSKENSVSWSNSAQGSRLFTDGKAAFTVAPLSYAATLNGKVDYLVLSVPKYSQNDSMETPLYSGYTFYAINSALDSVGRLNSSAVLQSMGAASSNILLNAYTVNIFKSEYRTENLNVSVLDAVKKRAYFEVIDSYMPALTDEKYPIKEGPAHLFRNEIMSYTNTISSESAYKLALQRNIDSYSAALEKIKGTFSSDKQ